MVRIFNVAATPKGVAIYFIPLHATRRWGERSEPLPLAMFPEPPRGFPAFHAFRSNSIFVVM